MRDAWHVAAAWRVCDARHVAAAWRMRDARHVALDARDAALDRATWRPRCARRLRMRFRATAEFRRQVADRVLELRHADFQRLRFAALIVSHQSSPGSESAAS